MGVSQKWEWWYIAQFSSNVLLPAVSGLNRKKFMELIIGICYHFWYNNNNNQIPKTTYFLGHTTCAFLCTTLILDVDLKGFTIVFFQRSNLIFWIVMYKYAHFTSDITHLVARWTVSKCQPRDSSIPKTIPVHVYVYVYVYVICYGCLLLMTHLFTQSMSLSLVSKVSGWSDTLKAWKIRDGKGKVYNAVLWVWELRRKMWKILDLVLSHPKANLAVKKK